MGDIFQDPSALEIIVFDKRIALIRYRRLNGTGRRHLYMDSVFVFERRKLVHTKDTETPALGLDEITVLALKRDPVVRKPALEDLRFLKLTVYIALIRKHGK